MQGVYSWQWHHCKKIFRWFRSVTHSSDFVTILICTTTTNPTTTKKGAELGKNPTQHSLTPFGQSWVVLARSQKTIRNLQVFFACKLDHRRPWFWKIVCAESPCRSAVVFFFRKHQVVLLSLQRTTHQYQRIWRWWWQTLFDPGEPVKHDLDPWLKIPHSCEGFHSLSA